MEAPVLRSRKGISLEMIDFQSDDFGRNAEMIVTELQKKILDNVYDSGKDVQTSNEVRDLSNLIRERFGLKVMIICDSALAAILPFYSNKNHIFIDEMFRDSFSIKGQEKIIREANGKRGTVNRKNATVGGLFSEYENKLYLNFIQLFKTFRLSVAETVAAMLHELGHAYYMCEYSDRLETSNQILQSVAQELSKKKDKSDRVYVFRELTIVNPKITAEEVDKLINGNSVIAGAIWFKMVIGTVQEQTSNSKYSQSSSEQLADNFAARFKYSRQLLTALEKLNASYDSIDKQPKWFPMYQLLEAIGFLVSVSLTFIIFPLSIPLALWFALMSFMTLRVNGEDFKDYTYDDLKVRYKRARNEYIQLLKDNRIPTSEVKEIVDDVYAMDRIISETHVYNSVIARVANFIFTKASDARASVVEQQLLEELSMNDLFLASAKLRTLNNKD
jgi:Zn-dependent protease with chaperone function